MQLKPGLWLVSVVLLLTSQLAQAALKLEVTQGIDDAMPIVVIPFTGQDNATAKEHRFARIIQADLKNSGRFRLVEPQVFQFQTYKPPVDFAYWRTMNADYIVKGEVKSLFFNRYEVSFQLFDVLSSQHEILSEQFTIWSKNARDLAHHISDRIYERLTGNKGVFSTRIAYVLVKRNPDQRPEYHLEIADADGYNPRVLFRSTQPIMSPAWSPDAKQLAFVSFENRRAEIYAITLSNGKRRLISQAVGINGAPAWSPDGNQLALVLSKTGQPKIYVRDLKTGEQTQLTQGLSIDTEPAWAPNGKSILFTSSRGGTPQIYRVGLANKKIERVTFKGNYNARASYTSDGKHIVMLHREGKGFNIAMQDLKTGQLHILTQSDLNESPSLAPNGKLVLYATQDHDNGVLAMVSTDGRVRLRLPEREGQVQEPAWSPFLDIRKEV